MSTAGFKAFMAALSGPAVPVPAMVDLFARAESGDPRKRR
jgi:uncharacterized protein (DUF1778 family)